MINSMHRITRALVYLLVPLCVYLARPVMAATDYDKQMATIQTNIAEKKRKIQSVEKGKALAEDNYNESAKAESTITTELIKRSKDLKYQAQRMKGFKIWNLFVTMAGGAKSLIDKTNPGSSAATAAVNFLADRAMEAGGNAPMKANMTKLKDVLDGTSPAQEKLEKIMKAPRSYLFRRLQDDGEIPKNADFRDYIAGKHDARFITAGNRYIGAAIKEVIKETDDMLAEKPWEKIQEKYKKEYEKKGKQIKDLKTEIAKLERAYKEAKFFRDAAAKAKAAADKATAEAKAAAKAKAAADKAAAEAKAAAKAKAAAGTTVAPGTGSPTTITKGHVKDKKGTITITETHRPDGSLIDVIHTTTDPDGNVISTTIYNDGTGEGITTTSVPATDSKHTTDPTIGYDPLDDPNLKKGKKKTLDMAAVSNLTGQFIKQQPGPQKEDSGNIGGGDYPTDQSDSYTNGTIGKPTPPAQTDDDQQDNGVKTPGTQSDDQGTGGLSDVTVNRQNITMTFWDHGTEDGDIINIYLNGSLLKGSITLKKSKRSFPVQLNSGKNRFEVQAVNEGTISPNTASVRISNVTSGKALQIYERRSGQKASMRLTAP